MKNSINYSIFFLFILATSCNMEKSTKETILEDVSIFPKGELITNNNFVGIAYLYMMGASDTTLHASFGNVTFDPEARTNWHSHPGGQILFITEGRGYYQAKGQPARLLQNGDVVEIPRDVIHWHGASPDSGFAHIAVSLNTDDGGAVWSGPVTDQEYAEATK